MAARKPEGDKAPTPRRRASLTPEGRENQLIDLAVNLAEKQLRDGTASAQVIGHYLKAGSTKEYLERQRLAMDVELMKVKREQIESMSRIEETYQKAIRAMRSYQGEQDPPEGETDVD